MAISAAYIVTTTGIPERSIRPRLKNPLLFITTIAKKKRPRPAMIGVVTLTPKFKIKIASRMKVSELNIIASRLAIAIFR